MLNNVSLVSFTVLGGRYNFLNLHGGAYHSLSGSRVNFEEILGCLRHILIHFEASLNSKKILHKLEAL